MKKIEELAEQIRADDEKRINFCDVKELKKSEEKFIQRFGHGFPDAFKRFLAISNGVYFNGAKIWSASPLQDSHLETIYAANEEYSEYLSDEFIYYGQFSDELYVYQLKTKKYMAIEYSCLDGWNDFKDAEEMFVYLLDRINVS